MINFIKCSHVEEYKHVKLASFSLGNVDELVVCLSCYQKIKTKIIDDFVNDIVRKFAREMKPIQNWKYQDGPKG